LIAGEEIMDSQVQSFLDTLDYHPIPDEWVNNTPEQGLLFRISGHPNWRVTRYVKGSKLFFGYQKNGFEYDETPVLHATPLWHEVDGYSSLFHLSRNNEESFSFLSVFKAHVEQQFYIEFGLQAGTETDKIGDIKTFECYNHHETNIDQRNEYLGTHVYRTSRVKGKWFLPNRISISISDALSKTQIY